MRYNDSLDTLALWQKYYPDKAKKALESICEATAAARSASALSDSLRRVGESAQHMTQEIQKIASASYYNTIDTVNEIHECVASEEKLNLEEEKPLDPEYCLTEVHSDIKFDWEQTEFTSMTNID